MKILVHQETYRILGVITSDDFRFTAKGATVYATELAWPVNRTATIHASDSAKAGRHFVKGDVGHAAWLAR